MQINMRHYFLTFTSCICTFVHAQRYDNTVATRLEENSNALVLGSRERIEVGVLFVISQCKALLLQTQLPVLLFDKGPSQPEYKCMRDEEDTYEKGMKWAYDAIDAVINAVSLPFPHRAIFTDDALSFVTVESVRNTLQEKYEQVKWLLETKTNCEIRLGTSI